MQNGRLSAIGPSNIIIARYLATVAGEFVGDGDLRKLRRRGDGNVRFRRMELTDGIGLPLTTPRTGEELNIILEFEGSRIERRSARIGITFCDAQDCALFICASELSSNDPLKIWAGDKTICRITRFPLSAGRYRINLFLERNGVIEDWLQDYVIIEVADNSFFGTARNLPLGWEGKTVLVDNQWRRFDDVDPSLEKEGPSHERGA